MTTGWQLALLVLVCLLSVACGGTHSERGAADSGLDATNDPADAQGICQTDDAYAYTPWGDVQTGWCCPPCEQSDCNACCDCPEKYCDKGDDVPCVGTPQDDEVCVPGGRFTMGSERSYQESPAHDVWLPPFFIEKTEVTNLQYGECVGAGKCDPPEAGSDFYDQSKGNHPVLVDVTMAGAYCKWRGKRLPTAAEWEKAARGTDGRIYPWGDQPPDCALANTKSCNGGQLQPVGSYPFGVSPYGVYDMAGNAMEFVDEWYREWAYRFKLDGCYPHWPCPLIRLAEPFSFLFCVVRGGGVFEDKSIFSVSYHRPDPWDLQVTTRRPEHFGVLAGFRCVRSAE